VRGSGAEQRRLLRGCSGAVALRAVCPAQITAGAPQNAVGPQVAEKPVGAVGRDLGYRAQQSRVAAGGRRVLGGARRLEVLDLNKDTVLIYNENGNRPQRIRGPAFSPPVDVGKPGHTVHSARRSPEVVAAHLLPHRDSPRRAKMITAIREDRHFRKALAKVDPGPPSFAYGRRVAVT
jgi:hypothetical protein